MPAKAQKLFRSSHREARLGRVQPGGLISTEVRPLALSIPKPKILSIKDTRAK